MEEKALTFDFSDETLNKVSCLIAHFGGVELIDPHGKGNDNSIGAFVMFIIKDACEFAGLLPKRKEIPARSYRNSVYKLKDLNDKKQTIGTLLGSFGL